MKNALKQAEMIVKCRVLRDKILPVASKSARYLLLERASNFLLECSFDGDRAIVDLGKSLAFASHVYELLVRGEVTPCTVSDIIEDLRREWTE